MDKYDKTVVGCFIAGLVIILVWFAGLGGELINQFVMWSGLILVGIGTGYFLANGKKK